MIDIEEAFGDDASDIQYRLLSAEFEVENGYSMTASNIVNQFIKHLTNGEHLVVASNPDTRNIATLHMHKYDLFIIINEQSLRDMYQALSEKFDEDKTHLRLGTFNINYKDTKADRNHLYMDTCFFEQEGDSYRPLNIRDIVELTFRLIQTEETITQYMKFNYVENEEFEFNKDNYVGIIV